MNIRYSQRNTHEFVGLLHVLSRAEGIRNTYTIVLLPLYLSYFQRKEEDLMIRIKKAVLS